MRCSVAETIDAANALKVIDLTRHEDVYTALKVTLAKSREAAMVFDRLMAELAGHGRSLGESLSRGGEGEGGDQTDKGDSEAEGSLTKKGERSIKASKRTKLSYSPTDVISRKRLRPPKPSEVVEGRRVVRRLRRRLALMEGRRYERSKKGELDIWKSVRSSYATLGEMLKFIKMRRKKTRTKIVLFVDVSGSMDSYSDWLLKTMHTICRYTHNVECFLFSTRLFRVTELLSKHSPDMVVELMWRWADMWGSGTKIGYCLDKFLRRYGEMVDKNTSVIIISDGWDTGEPRLLRRAMSELKERAGRVIWLNPYADKPSYRPLTIGMLTALPYIDVFAGTSVLNDMSSFVKVFGRSLKPLRRGEKIGIPRRQIRHTGW